MLDSPKSVSPDSPPGDLDSAGSGGIVTGGPSSFDAFYEREWRAAVTLGWSLTGSWAAGEDVAQDVFADVYRRWPHVSTLDEPGAWLRRAVINRSTSVHRRWAVEHRGAGRLKVIAAGDADGRHDDRTRERAVDRVGDPVFWAAVRSLPEQQRAAIVLHYLEDRSVAEIADLLDLRVGTVKTHLHRGRRSLANRLSEGAGRSGVRGTKETGS